MVDRVQIFLSAVSNEFKSYREALRNYLDRPNVSVKIQEHFIKTGSETLEKLDDYIHACDAVIHLAGDMTGACPPASAIESIQRRYPDIQLRLFQLKETLESGTPPISYTQWEAYLALYHSKTLLIATPEAGAHRDAGFRTDDGQLSSQKAHMDRLHSMKPHFDEIKFANSDKLAIEILRSGLQEILEKLPSEGMALQRRSRFGKDHVNELKNLLLNEAPVLRKENFVFTAFVQITGSIGPDPDSSRKIDSALIDTLAERASEHELLMLAYLCKERSHVLGLEALNAGLGDWLSAALSACDVRIEAVKGHCADALDSLDVSSPPTPSIEMGWSPGLRQTVKTLLTVRCKFIVADPGTDLGWACR